MGVIVNPKPIPKIISMTAVRNASISNMGSKTIDLHPWLIYSDF